MGSCQFALRKFREAHASGNMMKWRPKEYDLLAVLAQNPGIVVARERWTFTSRI